MSVLAIRELSDFPALVPAVLECFDNEWPKPNRNKVELERRIHVGQKDILPFTLIAIQDDVLAGFVSVIFHEEFLPKGRPHWIDAVYVMPNLRKNGIGAELIKAAKNKARDLKLGALCALTEIPALYEKQGWSVIEKIAPADFVIWKQV